MSSQWIPFTFVSTFVLVLLLGPFGLIGFATEHEGAAKERAVDVETHFGQALELWRAESYDDAIESFERALSMEPTNETILFNLGLAYGRTNREGRSVAYLRKALLLHPDSQRVHDALNSLEQKNPNLHRSTNLIESLQVPLRRWSYEIFVVLSGLALFSSGWNLINHLKKQSAEAEEAVRPRGWPKRSMLSFAMFLLLLGVVGLKLSDEFQSRATVIEAAELRSGPDERFATVSELVSGMEVQVKKVQSDWIQVEIGRGWTGWVLKSKIFLTSGG